MIRFPVGDPFIGQLELKLVQKALCDKHLTQGANVQYFEDLLGQFLRVKHVVVCSSGTTALHLALAGMGIGSGDEVLVPNLTYVATANAVSYTGAKPILVDVDLETWNIDLLEASSKISNRTRAILPVHLYGVPCDMDTMTEFASAYNLLVIEDAAEALGGYWHEKTCGTLGDCGTFSFYANKIITTGEGGAVVTSDNNLANNLRLLRGQGQTPGKRFWHEAIGFNYRMTDIQAAIGIAQLQQISTFLKQRKYVIDLYHLLLGNTLKFPMIEGTAPWLFTGLLPRPYTIVERRLSASGIETRPVFTPMHRLPMYKQDDKNFPNSCKIAENGISLPTYPGLTHEDVAFISEKVCEVVNGSHRH